MAPEDRVNDFWLDDDAGPVVRPYAVTRGRARSSRSELDLLTLVVASAPSGIGPGFAGCGPEHEAIVRLTQLPMTVVDISTQLDLPIGIVRVLVGDLMDRRLVEITEPIAAAGPPNDDIFEAVLNGLRAL